MLVSIDILKIVNETLRRYPTCGHKREQFESLLQTHLKEFQTYLDDSIRIGGLEEIKVDYEKVVKSHKSNFLQKDWSKLNVTTGETIHEVKARAELELQFFQAALDLIKEFLNKESSIAARLEEYDLVVSLISDGNLKQALKKLHDWGVEDAISLLDRFSRGKHAYDLGTIDYPEWDRIQNQIAQAARDLIRKRR